MAASPLTDDRWAGLPLLACHMDPGLYRIDVQTPMLVVREDLGTQVEVHDHSGRRVAFRQAPLLFDLFAQGLRMDAVSDRRATKSLVVALPAQWMPFDDAEPHGRITLGARFQFRDVEMRRLVWRLTTHFREGQPLGDAYSQAVSRTIVDRLVRCQLAADARGPDCVGLRPEARRLVESMIDQGLHEPLTVAQMAAAVGMRVAHFAREFKVTFEATPHQYVRQRRLLRASELLRSTDAPLSTIALETGFASHSHFSTDFRAAMGTTPSRFRRTTQAH